MSRTIGETLYRYTLRDGGFSVNEGVVLEYRGRLVIYFGEIRLKACCPRAEDIGVVSHGTTLWLTEKNDKLAKQSFIKYELERIAELEDQINKKRAVVKMLLEEGV